MILQEIKRNMNKQLDRIKKLQEHPQKAELAKLRRGVGRIPGELPELWGSFLLGMPEEWASKTGEPSKPEWAIYLALTLYALHQQGHSTQTDCMHKEGASLGRAVRKLVNPGEEPSESSALKRFNALATAEQIEEISHHLRGIIQLLRANGIPIDYSQLAVDLYQLQFSQSAPKVRLRWGQDFYAFPNSKTESDELGKEVSE